MVGRRNTGMDRGALRVGKREIVVRPMGPDYFMADVEPGGVAVELTCRQSAPVWPNLAYVAYYKKLTQAYGAAAILAWDNRSVVGFLPFRPKEFGMPSLPSCIHYVATAEGDENGPPVSSIENGAPTPFRELASRTLIVHCISVKPALRRNGVGLAMVACLVDWARAKGWDRIQGSAFLDGDWGWLPNVGFWEKAGFTRGTEEESELEYGPSVGFHLDLNER